LHYPYRFNAIVGLTAANSVNGATVQLLPSGPVYPLVAGTYSFDFQAKFTQFNLTTTAVTNSPPSRLLVIAPGSAGQFRLQLMGQASQQYVVEASTNLQVGSWAPVTTNVAVDGQFDFTESQSANFPVRFYRGRTAN